MAILETQGLTRRFGRYTAVDTLTLTIQSGEVFGLLGPNGAGKTTTLKMLTTLLPPTAGSARVAGLDVVRQAGEVRRVIGYVPQLVSADGTLTGYENLLIFAKLYDLPRRDREQRVRDALAFMGLVDVADKLVREYSGGMIRRLEIAQASLHTPRVLFLDEPTVGLDPVARQAVWERIEQLRSISGTTIMLTTHNMDEAESLCGRLGIMHLGKIVALGTPPELKSSIGANDATLDDVFAYYSGAELGSGVLTVRLLEPDAQRASWVEPVALRRHDPLADVTSFVDKTLVIAELEVRKLRHDATELITRAIQPALWLLVFGEVLTQMRAVPTGGLRYLDFMAPGILAQSVLFIAIFYGIAIIWERDLGIVHKFMASPTPRAALVLGKALSAGVRALSQAIIIYLLALLLGVQINWDALALLGVLLIIVLSAAFFSTFSLIIACLVKTRERFMGIGQVLTMPLFFASNAIYPIAIMPGWLQVISRVNPLTYEVDALRALMLANSTSVYGVGTDLAILFGATALLVVIGAQLYPRVVV